MNFKVKEAAEQLSVSPQTVYLLCKTGKLPHVRFGIGRGTIRITDQDLAAYVELCKQETRQATTATALKHIRTPSAGSP
jgi:excisionase family DNA binding protein